MVVEVKKGSLPRYIPQTIVEMYSAAVQHECVEVSCMIDLHLNTYLGHASSVAL